MLLDHALACRGRYVLACVLALSAFSANAADLPLRLDLPEGHVVPAWTKPDEQSRGSLGRAMRDSQKGVLLVGHPDVGLGTAWVLSRQHRLLVTNAHVADMMHLAKGKMFAILNTTAQSFDVKRVWYHPGLRRFPKGEAAVVVHSTKPTDGDVFPRSPDLAVLELSAEGPELPVELTMATPGELQVDELFGQSAALLGFPGHDTNSWPEKGSKALATFVDGVISRVTDFQLSPDSPDNERQFLQYTMATFPGFSGSPVVLANGHVIATHNMSRTVASQPGATKTIPHGIRVDCLWELLAHHGLDAKVPLPVNKSTLNIARWLQDSPEEINFRKAVVLVNQAANLVYQKQDFEPAAAKCKEAIALAPNYSRAYLIRAHASINYWFKYRRQLSMDQAKEQLSLAATNAREYVRVSSSDVSGYLLMASVLNNMGSLTKQHDYNRDALNLIDKVLSIDGLSNYDRADAHSKRGVALDNLDRDDEALREHNEAIRLAPKEPVYYENRAEFWHYKKRPELEKEDYATAKKLREGK